MADYESRRHGGLTIPTGAESIRGILLILLAYFVITGADAAACVLPRLAALRQSRGVCGLKKLKANRMKIAALIRANTHRP